MQMRADEVAAEAALLKTELAKLKDEEKTVPEPTSHAKRKQPEPDVMVALKKAKKVPRGTKAEAKVRSTYFSVCERVSTTPHFSSFRSRASTGTTRWLMR